MSEISLPKEVLLGMDIDELDISEHTLSLLNFLKINTIGQLCEMGEEDLKNIRNMTSWKIKEIKEALAEVGLGLK